MENQAPYNVTSPSPTNPESIPNNEKMRRFILELLGEFYAPDGLPGDIDGGEFQTLAEKHGILIPIVQHEPCGEPCECDQVLDPEAFIAGVTCYRSADWLNQPQPLDLDLARKALICIEGVCYLAGDMKLNKLYILAHVALGRCQADHAAEIELLEAQYKELMESGAGNPDPRQYAGDPSHGKE